MSGYYVDTETLMQGAAALAFLAAAYELYREAQSWSTATETDGLRLSDSAVAALDAGRSVTIPRYEAPDLELVDVGATDQDDVDGEAE